MTSRECDYDSVDCRDSIREICADLDRESVLPTIFSAQSKGKRDRDQKVVQTLKDLQNLHNILERKAELAVRGEKMGSAKICTKLRQTWRGQTLGIQGDSDWLVMGSIRSSIQLQQANRWADQAQREK